MCNDKRCCPVCRALCCIFNEKDTCRKSIPSMAPGYECPDFMQSRSKAGGFPVTGRKIKRDENRKRFYETLLQDGVPLGGKEGPGDIVLVLEK